MVTKCPVASDHPSVVETCMTLAGSPQIGHHTAEPLVSFIAIGCPPAWPVKRDLVRIVSACVRILSNVRGCPGYPGLASREGSAMTDRWAGSTPGRRTSQGRRAPSRAHQSPSSWSKSGSRRRKNVSGRLVRESMLTRQGEAIRRKPDLVVGGF